MNKQIQQELHSYVNKEKILDYMRFFKTGVGQYGEGDKFLGIKVPDTRKVVKKYFLQLSLDEVKEFSYSPYHEERMFALLVLVYKYKAKRVVKESKEEVYTFYMDNLAYINNWDLVDVTCTHIVGVHLLNKDRNILYKMAKSKNLWEKRIAIISTFAFINAGQFDDTLSIADILLDDKHDLIHKAVGWAIRNVGTKNLQAQLEFLNLRYKKMPRTMLRYAIEKFDEPLRQQYLKGLI
jgi:3-methyladenine DNA glycosylase AlkD